MAGGSGPAYLLSKSRARHARGNTCTNRYITSIRFALRFYDLTPTGAHAQLDWVRDDSKACGLVIQGSHRAVERVALRAGSLPSRAATTLIAVLSALLWAAVVLVVARLAAGA